MSPKAVKIWYWLVTILFSMGMLFSAVSELMQTESAQKAITDLGYPPYLNYILGIAKLLGVIAILQPKFKAIIEWAYAGFTIDFVGASLSMAFVGDSIGKVISPLPFIVVLFLSYYFWKKVQ